MEMNDPVIIYETGRKESEVCYRNVVYSGSLADALIAYGDSDRNYLIRYTYPFDPLQLRKVEYWDSAKQDFVGGHSK